MSEKLVSEMAIVSRLVGYSMSEQHSETLAIEAVSKTLPKKYAASLGRYKQFLQGDGSQTAELMPRGPYSLVNRLINIVKQERGDSAKLLAGVQSSISNTSAQVLEYWAGFNALISYLLIVLVVAFIVLSIYFFKIMPTFTDTFITLGQNLPQFTQLMFVDGPVFYIILASLLCMGLGIALASKILKKQISGLQPLSAIIGNIPGFDLLVQSYSYFLFLNFASSLIEADIKHQSAFGHAETLAGFDATRYRQFQSWHDALVCASQIGAVEKELEFQCEQIGPIFARQLVKARELFTVFAQVVLGCLIGAILVAMYLPIFSLGTAV